MKLQQILSLKALGKDRFRGDGPTYPWGGLYGGQLIAQALVAAGHTLASGRVAHSLHAHFIRRGENGEPVDYQVERERDGGSLSTRLVHAFQGDRRLLAATLSFATEASTHGRRDADLAALPVPETLPVSSAWLSQFERRGLPEATHGQLSSAAWMRTRDAVEDSPILRAAALAYLSDDLPTESVFLGEPGPPTGIGQFFSASLDHSLWFHGLPPIGEWLLMRFGCIARNADRGLAHGRCHDAQGRLVATISQEVLLRPPAVRT